MKLTSKPHGNKTHGESHYNGRPATAEYRTWAHIWDRCTNAKSNRYYLYGARGITVCTEWHTFEQFLVDMGRRPSPSHSIDRIDADGPYSPNNCRWATRQEQQENRRDRVRITILGRTLFLSQWCKEFGIKLNTAWSRIERGWPVEHALTTPLKRKKS